VSRKIYAFGGQRNSEEAGRRLDRKKSGLVAKAGTRWEENLCGRVAWTHNRRRATFLSARELVRGNEGERERRKYLRRGSRSLS